MRAWNLQNAARLLKYLLRCRLNKQDIDGVKVKHTGHQEDRYWQQTPAKFTGVCVFTLGIAARGPKEQALTSGRTHFYHGKGSRIKPLIYATWRVYVVKSAILQHSTIRWISGPVCHIFSETLYRRVPGFITHQTSPVVPYTHARKRTRSQLHRDYGEAAAQRARTQTTQVHTESELAPGRWQWPCHNLSLIIYTAWLTVLMQRPEKIQATNLICTQRQ